MPSFAPGRLAVGLLLVLASAIAWGQTTSSSSSGTPTQYVVSVTQASAALQPQNPFTVWPGSTCAQSKIICHAVTATTGTEAASMSVMPRDDLAFAFADQCVPRAHSRRRNPHQHFSWRRNRNGHVFNDNHLWAAKVMDSRGFHAVPLKNRYFTRDSGSSAG